MKRAGRLVRRGVRVSMAAVECPEENGYAERLVRTIKEEEVELTEYRDLADARRQLGRFLGTCTTGSGFTRPWAT